MTGTDDITHDDGHLSDEALSAHLDGYEPPTVGSHVATCASCSDRQRQLSRSRVLLSVDSLEAGEGFDPERREQALDSAMAVYDELRRTSAVAGTSEKVEAATPASPRPALVDIGEVRARRSTPSRNRIYASLGAIAAALVVVAGVSSVVSSDKDRSTNLALAPDERESAAFAGNDFGEIPDVATLVARATGKATPPAPSPLSADAADLPVDASADAVARAEASGSGTTGDASAVASARAEASSGSTSAASARAGDSSVAVEVGPETQNSPATVPPCVEPIRRDRPAAGELVLWASARHQGAAALVLGFTDTRTVAVEPGSLILVLVDPADCRVLLEAVEP